MKPVTPRLYAIFIIAALLVGCSVRDVRFAPKQLQITKPVLPANISRQIRGIHPAPPNDDPAVLCCAADGQSSFFVRKERRNARQLFVAIYWLESVSHSPKLLVSVAGETMSRRITRTGPAVFRIPLSAAAQKATAASSEVRVALRALGANFARTPPMLLTSVYFE